MSYCLMGIVWNDENILEMHGSDDCTYERVELYTLK